MGQNKNMGKLEKIGSNKKNENDREFKKRVKELQLASQLAIDKLEKEKKLGGIKKKKRLEAQSNLEEEITTELTQIIDRAESVSSKPDLNIKSGGYGTIGDSAKITSLNKDQNEKLKSMATVDKAREKNKKNINIIASILEIYKNNEGVVVKSKKLGKNMSGKIIHVSDNGSILVSHKYKNGTTLTETFSAEDAIKWREEGIKADETIEAPEVSIQKPAESVVKKSAEKASENRVEGVVGKKGWEERKKRMLKLFEEEKEVVVKFGDTKNVSAKIINIRDNGMVEVSYKPGKGSRAIDGLFSAEDIIGWKDEGLKVSEDLEVKQTVGEIKKTEPGQVENIIPEPEKKQSKSQRIEELKQRQADFLQKKEQEKGGVESMKFNSKGVFFGTEEMPSRAEKETLIRKHLKAEKLANKTTKKEIVPETKSGISSAPIEAPLVPASFKKEVNPEVKVAPVVETAKEKTPSETKPEEARKLLKEKELKISDYEKSEAAVKEFLKKNWGVESVPSDLSKWSRSEELKPLLENRDAAKSGLEKIDPLYFKEKENDVLRENFVKAQLDFEKVKQAGGYDPEDFKTKKAPFEGKYNEAKKLYYESLKNNEGLTGEEKAKFVAEEFNKLQDIKIDLHSEEEVKKAYFPFNTIKNIGNWYKEQPAKQKYIVAAALIGTGALAGFMGLGGAVALPLGLAITVSRALSGAGAAVGAESMIKKGFTTFGMRLKGHEDVLREKGSEEIEKITKGAVVGSLADFLKEKEGELSAASERLYKESKKLETQRALISGAMGAVIATGAFTEAIKNVMHWTGTDKLIKNTFDWWKEHLSFGGHEKLAGVAGAGTGTEKVIDHARAGTEVSPSNPEAHHYVGEVKSGGNMTRAAFEAGHQAGVSHERIEEAMRHSYVKDIHGNLISLDKTDLVQPGAELEFIPKGTIIDGHPTDIDKIIATGPKGSGFGSAADLSTAKNTDAGFAKFIDKRFPLAPEIKPDNLVDRVANIEMQFNKDNAFLLDKIPSGLKESIINSDKVVDYLGHIKPGFDKLNFEQQNDVLKFVTGKINIENANNVGEAAVLSEKLYEHLSQDHSYLKNAIKFINVKEGVALDAVFLDSIKDKSVDDLYKTIKTMSSVPGLGATEPTFINSSALPTFQRIGDFMTSHGFKGGGEKISEVLGKIATNLRNK